MNIETAVASVFSNNKVFGAAQDELVVLNILKHSYQTLIALANLVGDQESAHRYSKQLCTVLAREFQINPHARRSRNA